MVNKMNLIDESIDGDEKKFILQSKAEGGSSSDGGPSLSAFIFCATSKEERDIWFMALKGLLETQSDFLRALQSPIAYQKGLTTQDL